MKFYIVLSDTGFNGKAPERFRLFPRGEIRIKGEPPAIMDDEAAQLIMASFQASDHDMVIDYEHQTLEGIEAPAAGWIVALEWDQDGLWARVRWTAKARTYIAEGEYRYFSPVMSIDVETRRIVKLHHLALTNAPGLQTIEALAAKEYLSLKTEEGGNPMLKKILKMLGLAEDVSEEQALVKLKEVLEQWKAREAEITALKDKLAKAGGGDVAVACKEVMDELGLPADADKDKVVASVIALKEPAKVSGNLARKIQELEARVAERDAASLTELALKEGKTTKAELDSWGRDMAKDTPDLFKTVVLSRDPGSVVPLDKVEVLKDTPKTSGQGDEAQLSVNKQLGISDETYKKFGPQAEGGA